MRPRTQDLSLDMKIKQPTTLGGVPPCFIGYILPLTIIKKKKAIKVGGYYEIKLGFFVGRLGP